MSKLQLGVEVLGAHNLPIKDGVAYSRFFVELKLANETFSTSTREKDPNPVWNERFFFNIPDSYVLSYQTLEASVYTSSSSNKSSPSKSLLGRVRIAGTSFVFFSDANVTRFPLEKRNIFSSVRGELTLKVYLTEDASPFDPPPPPPPPPVHVFRAQPSSPGTSPTVKKSPEKKPKPKHVFHHLPKQKHQTHESKSETRPAMMSFSSPFYSPPTKPFFQPPWREEKPLNWGTHSLVEQMQYLFVRVVKARNLAADEIIGVVDPFVEIQLGNYTAQTRSIERSENPQWNQVFAFSRDRLHASQLIVMVKDKNLMKDDFVGRVLLDPEEVPSRVPPDSPLAPEWYRLESKKGTKLLSELMLAVWKGFQADEAFSEAVLSENTDYDRVNPHHLQGKVYHAPRLWYVRLEVIEAQDIVSGDRRKPLYIRIRASVGRHADNTRFVRTETLAQSVKWNEKFIFVAAEPFEEDLEISVEEKTEGNKTEVTGGLILKLSELEKRWDEKPVDSRWYTVKKPESIDVDLMKKHKFSSRLYLNVYLDGAYHVFDGPTQFASDLRPTAKQLSSPIKTVGVLELGILSADNLSPMRNHDGKSSANVYCVAKYGQKWVRTRTASDNLMPKFNEQYTWQVFDPATVLTVAVFQNNFGASTDNALGKVRIRLSTLEIGRAYKRSFPLVVLDSSQVKRNGELQLAVRFSSLGFMNVIWKYADPLYPKLHYKRPFPPLQQDTLRGRASEIVVARLGKMEPPLKKEVIEYINKSGNKDWSMRKGNAHFHRLMNLLSGPRSVLSWFRSVCQWESTLMTVLVHLLFIMLVMFPELIIPTVFLYMFVLGLWNYFYRVQDLPGIDLKLSQAENPLPDAIDEELDTFPSSRNSTLTRHRYDRLRVIGGKALMVAGDIANLGERIQALLSWRDPRATFIFWVACLVLAIVMYVIPFRVVVLLGGLYAMRPPKLRSNSSSVVINFFKRLPCKSDDLL